MVGGLLLLPSIVFMAIGLDPKLSFDPSLFRAGSNCQKSGVIVIDVENLRGRANFDMSHWELLEALTLWSDTCGLRGKLNLIVDHGYEPSAFWLEDRGLSVAFAGRIRKADDVIANDLGFWGRNDDVTVVTADQGLIFRCEREVISKSLQIISPAMILQDLEKIAAALASSADRTEDEQSQPERNVARSPRQIKLDYHVKLGAELLETEVLLKNRIGIKNKRRKKLKLKSKNIREKLENGRPSMLDRVSDILEKGRRSESLDEFAQEEQDALLARLDKARSTSKRKERTGDRVVLAEHLRKELHRQYGEASHALASTEKPMLSPAQAYAQRLLSKSKDVHMPKDTIKLVVISDTHGFESLMTKDGKRVPDGDVLLHLGDFAIDHGPVEEALEKFDIWLSEQPHPTKIILRGNHDPKIWTPVISGATYVTRPVVMGIRGFSFSMLPYVAGGLSNRRLPKDCDVLASHIPPRSILDRCETGKYAGSTTLKKAIDRMKSGPPSLWLCGHIHEARGVKTHVFCLDKETTVINAAQANSGIAATIEYGPTVVELKHDDANERGKKVQLIEMDGQYTFLNRNLKFFESCKGGGKGQLLLSVDLGLRTGISLFNDDGELLKYKNFHLQDEEELESVAAKVIDQWPKEIGSSSTLNCVAIEGNAPRLWKIWRKVAEKQHVLELKPDEWREDLLSRSESDSGENAKTASLLIARQIINDYGANAPVEELGVDVAESLMLGLHVSRRLGWIAAEPKVRRHSNGTVCSIFNVDSS